MYQALIIGYGPVGMTAANFLGQLDWKVAVLEKNETFYQIPRAIHLDDESLRILQNIDLHQKLLPFLKPVKGMQLLSSKGKLLLETTKKTTSGFAASNLFFQPDLEKVLDKGVERFKNLELFWNTEALKILQKEEYIEVQTNQKTFQSKYLLLCNGAKSILRNDLGIQLKDLKFRRANLKVDVKLKEEVNLPDWIQKTCKAGAGARVFLNSIGNRKRWEFTLPKNISKEEAEKESYILEQVKKVISPEKIEIEHAVVYRFQTKIAKNWQKGNIFILGDTAHQIPPYIGQGMCTGLRDVHNLVWKLSAIEKNIFSKELLKSYQIERENHLKQVIFLTLLLGRVFTTHWGTFLSWVAPVIPKKWRKIEVQSLKINRGFWQKHKLSGQWFPQFELKNQANKIKLLDDFLGKNTWVVISFEKDLDIINQSSKISFEYWKITSKEFSQEENSLIDFTKNYQKWFEKYKIAFVTIRPDKHIFGLGKTQKEISTLIKNILKKEAF